MIFRRPLKRKNKAEPKSGLTEYTVPDIQPGLRPLLEEGMEL